MTTRSLNHMIAILFIFGLVNSIRTNIGYIYLIEMMPKKHETTFGTIWNCAEGLIFLQATLWFYYVSKDWYGFVQIGYCMMIFSSVAVWFLPESPIYLLNKGRYGELKEALQ